MAVWERFCKGCIRLLGFRVYRLGLGFHGSVRGTGLRDR